MTLKPVAVCLGGSLSVWDDMAAALALIGLAPYIVVACNYAGIQYANHLDAWVTLHQERFQPWRDVRAARGLNTDYMAFCHPNDIMTDAEVVPQKLHGSSGLYMAQIALEHLDCAGAILCGVPMDDTGGHIHHGGNWSHADRYREAMILAKQQHWPVKSMSGGTAELFGKPDAAWIAGLN